MILVVNCSWADILFEACLHNGAGLLPPETQHLFHSLDDALRRTGQNNTIHMGNLSRIAWPGDGEDSNSTASLIQGIVQRIARVMRSVMQGTESAHQISLSIQHGQWAADEASKRSGRLLSDMASRLTASEFLSSIRVGSAGATDTHHLQVLFADSLPDLAFDEGSVRDFFQKAMMLKVGSSMLDLGIVETARASKRLEALQSCWAISWFNV